jgi:hypothetical protein
MKNINFTKAKLATLKKKYDKARMEGHEQFQFEGQTILVAYAKYLIEYLEMQFGDKHEHANKE